MGALHKTVNPHMHKGACGTLTRTTLEEALTKECRVLYEQHGIFNRKKAIIRIEPRLRRDEEAEARHAKVVDYSTLIRI